MPWKTQDPWRSQYFQDIECPENVVVPLKDYDAYVLCLAHRWVYDKLQIAERQGLVCAPHGVVPRSFPVFSKPTHNLRGGSAGSRILHNVEEYYDHCTAGHMWSEMLEGDHVSTDFAVLNGKVVWCSHSLGVPSGGGTFERWEINISIPDQEQRALIDFMETHLPGYTGMTNAETIGGKIIEMHLRFSDQWPDLYPRGFLPALVGLYQGKWVATEELERNEGKGFSIVLSGDPERASWVKPDAAQVDLLRQKHHISSIQLAFCEDELARRHTYPPGGFRLAVINGRNLLDCLKARVDLAALFSEANSSALPAKPVNMEGGMLVSTQAR